jgi:spermidine synthase
MLIKWIPLPSMPNTAQQIPQAGTLPTTTLRVGPLYVAAGISAFSGVAYELLLATYATFLMGASIFQYSLVLSLMMASMGVGSLLADKAGKDPVEAFLATEAIISLVAVVALPVLYFAYARSFAPSLLLCGFVIVMGGAIGMEIPLLNRIPGARDRLARLLFYDYLGGFLGGVVFPLILIPRMSLMQIAGSLAVLNASIACVFSVGYRKSVTRGNWWMVLGFALFALSVAFLVWAEPIRLGMERGLFGIGSPP